MVTCKCNVLKQSFVLESAVELCLVSELLAASKVIRDLFMGETKWGEARPVIWHF
jgi:hypothetical protein